MFQKLPEKGRPRLNNYRRCGLGTDLARSFFDDLKSIDNDFYLVWHPYQTIWDEIINEGIGTNEEPRYAIQDQYGELCFGYVMRSANNSSPAPDNTWHVWRYAWPHGWAHVFQLKSTDPEYLNIVVENLYLQKQLLEKHGPTAFGHHQAEKQEDKRKAALKLKEEMHKNWQKENSWLLRKAMENAARGIYESTNPTKDVIMSGQGMNHRSRIIRPITEKEGGIYNPED